VIEEGTMNLVNSKDVVADRIRDIQAQAAVVGRRPGSNRQRRAMWRGLAALTSAASRVRPQSTMKTVEEL
jgi:hypothetical protein